MDVTVSEAIPSGLGPTGAAIRNDRPTWSEQFVSDPAGASWRARFGFFAFGSLPLHKGGTAIGANNPNEDSSHQLQGTGISPGVPCPGDPGGAKMMLSDKNDLGGICLYDDTEGEGAGKQNAAR